jgi:histidine triad (HIT) family protein
MYNHQPKNYRCPLCSVVKKQYDNQLTKASDVVYEDKEITAFINPKQWPNNPGNILIIPNKHYENIYDIPDDLLSRIYLFVKKLAIALKKTYKCDGTSTRQHNEPAGNQDTLHFHVHIFPRYRNDRLYQLYDQKRWTTPEERKPYADKLRKYFSSLHHL